ncbi:hypothetical protein [Dermacoccus nishinomiyaensis]|uniref:hypothetical protein n=1 Tax=Dermacoccus nishinomiyaensis TaxID=1274 RepID=UPI0011613543|nr:hypothetical protein [Dermacoccus nishinomiyaensis]
MSTMKNLVVRPADVSLNPLGATSGVAGVEVTVAVDRDVALTDGTFIAGGVPIVATSMPTAGLRVPVLANDDPSITTGAGFSLVVTARYSPRYGMHGRPQETVRRIVITSADPANVNFADAQPVRQVPFYMRPSEYVTYLETNLSQAQTDLTAAQSTIAAQTQTIAAVQARNAAQAATISGLQAEVAQAQAQIVRLTQSLTQELILVGDGPPAVMGGEIVTDLYLDQATGDVWQYA